MKEYTHPKGFKAVFIYPFYYFNLLSSLNALVDPHQAHILSLIKAHRAYLICL